MVYNVAMLLKQHMIDYCQPISKNRCGELELHYYSYETLPELEELYQRIAPSYDGIITSGIIPHGFLESLHQNDEMTFAHFRFDIENTYRIILQQSIVREDFDLSRIGMDFIPSGQTLKDVIAQNELPSLVKQFVEKFHVIQPEELDQEEEKIAENYLLQYQAGKIDFIVTYFYSTVLSMAAKGIDCFYLYPSLNEINYVMDSMLQKISLRKATKSLPAVIRIDIPTDSQYQETSTELYLLEMQKTILEFIQAESCNMSVKNGFQYFELYSDASTLSTLTEHFHYCHLYPVLENKVHFNGSIGYGIGTNFYHARANAIDASNYAKRFFEENYASFLIDEHEHLSRLPVQKENMTSWMVDIPSDYLHKIGLQVKLSPETIQKIIGVLYAEDSDVITSLSLINRLGVSSRTANRYLANLVQYGRAKIIGQTTTKGKGRPINLYELDLRSSK